VSAIAELSSRSGDGIDVALLWQQRDNTANAVVVDHPYAYAAQRRIADSHIALEGVNR
jgi:hypothetical protein